MRSPSSAYYGQITLELFEQLMKEFKPETIYTVAVNCTPRLNLLHYGARGSKYWLVQMIGPDEFSAWYERHPNKNDAMHSVTYFTAQLIKEL